MAAFVFDSSKELLLKPNNSRYCLFPIEHHDIWNLSKQALSSFWVVEEIDFTKDLDDWNYKLNDNERFFIKNILAFFASSDGIINENLALNFYNEVQLSEARYLYASQIQIEAIHGEAYSLMIDTLITDTQEKLNLFNAINDVPIVKKKAEWAFKWLDKTRTFPERLLAFGIIEGLFFSGSFCAIFWLKNRKLMPSLTKANRFIARDESLHCETAILLYNKLSQRLPESIVHQMYTEAIAIEKEFITESIPAALLGMNSGKMIEYIQYIADYWLLKLKYRKLFGNANPFQWIEAAELENKNNMFEIVGDSYAKSGVGNHVSENIVNFEVDV